MLAWISENLGTIIVCAALLAGCAGIIVGMVKNKKKGRPSCGCGCKGCPMSGKCYQKSD